MTREFGLRPFIVLLSISSFIAFLSISRWDESHHYRLLSGDASDYYAFLPAIFIDKDLTFKNYKKFPNYRWRSQFRARKVDETRVVNKFTYGVALFELPFFLMAHWTAPDNEPFISEHYEFFIALGGMLYLLLGMCFLWSFLSHFYSKTVSSITCLLLVFATNLYYHSFYDPGFSHIYIFALFSTLLVLMMKARTEFRYFLYAVLVVSLMTIIRPINVWFGLIMLYPMLKNQYLYIKKIKSIKSWFFVFIIFIVPLMPQFLYLKYATGEFFYDAYIDELFFFLDPRIMQGFFSFRNGWLIYSPIMILIFPGFFFIYKKNKELFYLSFSTFLVHVYITFSWWAWWYCCGFGIRPMVDFLPMLSIPMAAFIQFILGKRYMWIPSIPIVAFLVFLNVFQSNQHFKRIIHHDGMTFDIYKKVFLKRELSETEIQELKDMLIRPDYAKNPIGIGR